MRALCHVQNEATSVNSRVLRRGQFSRGLSIVPLAGYNCLSNFRPWGEFALSISRGSPALHTVPETIDRCIIFLPSIPWANYIRRPFNFSPFGELFLCRPFNSSFFEKLVSCLLFNSPSVRPLGQLFSCRPFNFPSFGELFLCYLSLSELFACRLFNLNPPVPLAS